MYDIDDDNWSIYNDEKYEELGGYGKPEFIPNDDDEHYRSVLRNGKVFLSANMVNYSFFQKDKK
jgi:hypothetical protein